MRFYTILAGVLACSIVPVLKGAPESCAADLSGAAAEALAILEDQPLPPHVISERMLLTSGSMTSLLDTLEKRGLVRRRTHPDDRRKLLVEVTEAGRSVLDQMLPRVHAFCNEVFSVLSAPEREQLINLLARVRGRLASTQRAPISPGKSRRKKR